MDATTATGSAGAGVQSHSAPPDGIDADIQTFDGLMDRIIQNDQDVDPTSGRREQRADDDQEGQQQRDDGQRDQEGDQEVDPNAQAKDKGQKEGKQDEGDDAQGKDEKEYDSLDAYLSEQKIDPESFKTLPVTVKVDGKEEAVPLGEVIKGYQLASASYSRMSELAQERTQFTGEQTQVRQALGVQIQRTEALLKMAHEQLLGDFAQFTPQVLAQLRMENPGQYAAIQQDYANRQGAIAAALQQVDAARKQIALDADKQRAASIPQQMSRLLQARPEWRDPAKATAAQTAMRTLGRKMGFTDAELAGVHDYRYLLVLDMAARYAHLQANQSATLTRVRSAPRMAKPGSRKPVASGKVATYRQAQERVSRDPTNSDAQAALFEHFV